MEQEEAPPVATADHLLFRLTPEDQTQQPERYREKSQIVPWRYNSKKIGIVCSPMQNSPEDGVEESCQTDLNWAMLSRMRHHLKTYPNCFVAKELIDWLIDHKEASDRETAIKLVQKLLDRSIIHHVCDEHKEFKDLKLFYRFRKDDGTFPLDNEVKAFMRGQRIYEKYVPHTVVDFPWKVEKSKVRPENREELQQDEDE
ncbi:hypothetical protein L345_06643, partial [Ophiophagus hannah]